MVQETPPLDNVLVRRLHDAASYWQPVPANGHVTCIMSSQDVRAETPFGVGRQTIAPGGCYVRVHAHPENDELIHFIEGSGRIEFDDGAEVFPAEPGTTVFIGKGRRHSFVNDSDAPLTFFWLLMPSGLEPFFQAIGRPRNPGDPAPDPFPRPDNVAEIEARTVFDTPRTGA
jgi:mannose-6-phosphate isomerase-like protein (cupin superfamily)